VAVWRPAFANGFYSVWWVERGGRPHASFGRFGQSGFYSVMDKKLHLPTRDSCWNREQPMSSLAGHKPQGIYNLKSPQAICEKLIPSGFEEPSRATDDGPLEPFLHSVEGKLIVATIHCS
jgi:hypothetical protein